MKISESVEFKEISWGSMQILKVSKETILDVAKFGSEKFQMDYQYEV